MSVQPPEKKARVPVTLGYWNIRGLAQPVRLLLKYARVEFEEVRYGNDDVPEWSSVKCTLGLDFPNLPYLIDGDVKLTQSNTLLAYIGRKADIGGSNVEEQATTDMLINVIMDMRNGFVRLCYNSKFDSLKEDYLKKVKDTISTFSNFLDKKSWLIGDQITYPDFFLYEMLDQHRSFEPSLFSEAANLTEYMDRFEDLPAIKEYMSSPDFIKYPINGQSSSWPGPSN